MFCPCTADSHDAAHLEHLDEGDSEVEVDRVAEVEGEGHEEAHRHDAQHVEPHCHLALDLHHLQNLQQTTPTAHRVLALTLWLDEVLAALCDLELLSVETRWQ